MSVQIKAVLFDRASLLMWTDMFVEITIRQLEIKCLSLGLEDLYTCIVLTIWIRNLCYSEERKCILDGLSE